MEDSIQSDELWRECQTARVEIRPSGGHTYAVVVEDVRNPTGGWEKRVIRSFGNASNPRNVEAAHAFANAANILGVVRTARKEVTKDDVKSALKLVLGVAVAGAVAAVVMKALLDWLADD